MEPPRKRRNVKGLSDEKIGSADCRETLSALSCNMGATSTQVMYSTSDDATPSTPSPTLSACDFLLNIKNYIPAGCLRLERYKCLVTAEVWTSCNKWRWLGHPREILAPHAGPFLENALQEALFRQTCLQTFRNLHQAGWIRLEFKMRDTEWGQIRAYILPEDIGRRMIDRADQALRRSLQHFIAELDIAKATWDSEWSELTPIAHIDTALDKKQNDDVSLFYLFNTLPSPNPDCSAVRDPYARSAMNRILHGTVEGLKTKMMAYQRRSAAMMLQKEAHPAQFVDPRLRKTFDQNGVAWYCDVTTGSCLRTPRMYEAARGGICAETMGLGKTLICLALILATRELSSQIPAEYSVGTIPVRRRVGSLLDMSAATIGRTGTPWKEYFNQRECDGSEYFQCKEALKRGAGYYHIPGPIPRRTTRRPASSPARKIHLSTTTLVVVPANLVRQWEREIEKHTTGLKVLVMKNNQIQLPPAAELSEYDIILFSRQRFDRESRDGSDSQGRRASSTGHNNTCPQLPSGEFTCDHFDSEKVYHSPLRDLNFKRLITDEGHTMGNANSTSKNNAVIVVDSLQLSARWIVSGTPTQGLYGAESMPNLDEFNDLGVGRVSNTPKPPKFASSNLLDADQERKDLEKLGNIATTYLKSRPWSNTRFDEDFASWSQYVMQPRHGSRSHGNMGCLRSTLEGMMIRHRPADVEKDVELPPLYQKIVRIEGSLQDKLSLNMFSLMITSNAVTSERKDADYLFHPRQRKALAQLVANLRQASFFWAGITKTEVEFTLELANKFLAKPEIRIPDEDRSRLIRAIEFGETALSNSVWRAASENHEMPYYVKNNWNSEIRDAWALDGNGSNPTLVGSTQLIALQKFAIMKPGKYQSGSSLEDAGRAAMAAARAAAAVSPAPISQSKASKVQRKLGESLPALAGGLRVTEDTSPKKRPRKSSITTLNGGRKGLSKPKRVNDLWSEINGSQQIDDVESPAADELDDLFERKQQVAESSKALPELSTFLTNNSSKILSTASSKLSYLITQVLKYYKSEKIIVFYETDNVAYYLAQALEVVNVEHLIYAKSLSSDRRSSYIVTFNQSSRFRVLLMDISQAAFGLDVSSASRVYFINPVFHKQIEAQAVKRAHRIGQFRPVYVETLVLRDSIEEVIVERRKAMSNDEQKKCKSVLDDETMYDWIENVRFVPLPKEEIPGPEQMALLETPQPVFTGKTPVDGSMDGPDAGLMIDFSYQPSGNITGKRPVSKLDQGIEDDTTDSLDKVLVNSLQRSNSTRNTSRKRRKRVAFLIDDTDDSEPSPEVGKGTSSPRKFCHPNTIPFSPSSAFLRSAFSPQPSPDGTDASQNSGSREVSPSKEERSRLGTMGARSLLVKLGIGSGAASPRASSSTSPSSSRSSSTAGLPRTAPGTGNGWGIFPPV